MKTFKQIREFNQYASAILRRHPISKISYSLKKVLKKLKMVEDYNNELEDIRVECCYTNNKGVIEYDITKDSSGNEVRHYKYTKEDMKQRLHRMRELVEQWNNKTFEVNPYFVTEVPDDITMDEREALLGFVLVAEDLKQLTIEDLEKQEPLKKIT